MAPEIVIAINNEAFSEIVEFHILMMKLSLASNEIESFAGAINRARGTCWARVCALVRGRARLTETPGTVTFLSRVEFYEGK